MSFWIVLAVNEVLGWALLIAFAMTRYWYHRRRLSWWLIAALVANELWALPLALREVVAGGRGGVEYALAVIQPLVLVFAGGLWFRELDRAANRITARVKAAAEVRSAGFWRGAAGAVAEIPARRRAEKAADEEAARTGRLVPDLEHAQRERRNWYVHLAGYVVVVGGLWLAFRFTPLDAGNLLVFGTDTDAAGERLAGLRATWTTVLVIDFFWSFSYGWGEPRMKRLPAPQEPVVELAAADRPDPAASTPTDNAG